MYVSPRLFFPDCFRETSRSPAPLQTCLDSRSPTPAFRSACTYEPGSLVGTGLPGSGLWDPRSWTPSPRTTLGSFFREMHARAASGPYSSDLLTGPVGGGAEIGVAGGELTGLKDWDREAKTVARGGFRGLGLGPRAGRGDVEPFALFVARGKTPGGGSLLTPQSTDPPGPPVALGRVGDRARGWGPSRLSCQECITARRFMGVGRVGGPSGASMAPGSVEWWNHGLR